MKILLVFVSLLSLCSCAQHAYDGPKKDKSQVAKVTNNADAVLILAVDGKKPPKKILYEKEFHAYLEPAVHRFTIKHSLTSYIPIPGGGLLGLASSNAKVEDICFELKAGESYFIGSNVKTQEPIVERNISFASWEPVTLLSCD